MTEPMDAKSSANAAGPSRAKDCVESEGPKSANASTLRAAPCTHPSAEEDESARASPRARSARSRLATCRFDDAKSSLTAALRGRLGPERLAPGTKVGSPSQLTPSNSTEGPKRKKAWDEGLESMPQALDTKVAGPRRDKL